MAETQEPQPELAESGGLTALGLVQIAWQRRMLVLVGVVVSLVLGTLYYLQSTAIYQATAQVLVVRKRAEMGLAGSATVEDYVSTQQVLIKSPKIINRAIKRGKLDELRSFQNQNVDVADAIAARLNVTRNKSVGMAGGNNVLDLSFRAEVPRDCMEVLDNITMAYKDFLDEMYRDMSDDTLKLVTEARDGMTGDLAEKKAAYAKFRNQSPLLVKHGDKGATVRLDQLNQIDTELTTLSLRKAKLLGQLEAIADAKKNGSSRAVLLAMLSDVSARSEGDGSKHGAGMGLAEHLFALRSEEQKLLKKFGPNHPMVQAVRDQIEYAKLHFSGPAAAWQEAVGESGSKDAAASDPVEQFVQYLKLHLAQVENQETRVKKLFDSAYSLAHKQTKFELEDETRRKEIDQMNSLVDGTVKRLSEINLAKNTGSGGFEAQVIAPPSLGKQVSPRILFGIPVVVGVAVVMGFMAGVGLAYLAELTDRSFRSPEDIRRRLGLPLVGYIPRHRPEPEAIRQKEEGECTLDPSLCTHYKPKSANAEAFRGLRTALYFSTASEGYKILQVTSPNPGDGKSTVTGNLAISIAKSGKRVILIDADLRKPRVHKLFGIEAAVGLASVIQGTCTPEAATQECAAVSGLSLMPCGPIPSNPAEMLTSPRFQELLKSLSEQYDFVLVDTPPLLAVTDPGVVATRVDGTVLTVRITKNGRPGVIRAKDILDSLGARMLGVVVNGTGDRSQSYGGGYGGGYGGYGSGYGYGYGYDYGYAEDYHNEEPAGEPTTNGAVPAATDAGESRL
jgi:capsular exopolysaccharide synthesis family protein